MLGRALICCAALALLASALRSQDQGEPSRVQALYSQASYGEALEEAARLSDPVLAAEWRTYLYLGGGDYPGALRAARDGLRLAPDHRGLLSNAIHVELTLGLADEALEHLEALERALDASPDPVAPQEVERVARLRAAAQEQSRLELAGRSSLLRARVLVLAALACVVGSMLAFALRPIQRAEPRTDPATPPRRSAP